MPFSPPADAPRLAVVDLGSNSVRLVVFEGLARNPLAIFNEKAVLRLGRGLQASGRLNAEGVAQALTVLRRYRAIARAMGAVPFEVLATAAVRDASNGADFVADLQSILPDVPIRVLSGAEEATLSAEGVLCGIPSADGLLADIGGGSLELVQLRAGTVGAAHTLPLGVIRLAERAGGDPAKARGIVEAELATIAELPQTAGRDLYLVGGAWRALARIHIAQTNYPLNIVHHYAFGRDEARDLAALIGGAARRVLERLPGVPRRRIDDLPFAAVVLRRLLRATGAARVVFSANGLREGWYLRQVAPAIRAEEPLLAASRAQCQRLGRDPALPPALLAWSDPLFPDDTPAESLLRAAACWVSDIGSHDHPEYRAEQAFLRILRQPGVSIDHHARAYLALALAMRYEAEAEAPFLLPALQLLAPAPAARAGRLGLALRLAYTLSAGTPDLLAATRLSIINRRLTLSLAADGGAFAGEAVLRRLERLAQASGLEAAIVTPSPATAASSG
uniref:Ppx/GppA family phosphatase n=1 Tax=Acidicaldus sp. TaxID=1872105 RepID=A0A8J4H8U0_9PROT